MNRQRKKGKSVVCKCHDWNDDAAERCLDEDTNRSNSAQKGRYSLPTPAGLSAGPTAGLHCYLSVLVVSTLGIAVKKGSRDGCEKCCCTRRVRGQDLMIWVLSRIS